MIRTYTIPRYKEDRSYIEIRTKHTYSIPSYREDRSYIEIQTKVENAPWKEKSNTLGRLRAHHTIVSYGLHCHLLGRNIGPLWAWWALKIKSRINPIQNLNLISRDFNFLFKSMNSSCSIWYGIILIYKLPNNLTLHYNYTVVIYGNYRLLCTNHLQDPNFEFKLATISNHGY